jgi:phosphatidylserine decarboxylase
VQQGDTLRVGQRVGVMKFGSRMDVFLPTDLPIRVAVGESVVAGVTVLSQWIAR